MSKRSRLNTEKGSRLSVIRTLLFSSVVFSIVGLLGLIGAWSRLDRAAYDALLRLRINVAPLAMSPRILPVDLNDRAERNLGGRIDNRKAFVDLFTVLGEGGLSGGMDFLFAGSKDPAIDASMALAAGKMESLVLAVVPLDKAASNFSGEALAPEDDAILRRHLWHPIVKSSGRIPSAVTFLVPDRALAANSKYLGHIGVSPDSDGIYRKVPLFYRWGDGYMPSLPLALAAAQFNVDTSRVVIDAGRSVSLPIGAGKTVLIPIDTTGSAWIPYPSDWMSGWKRVPLDRIVNAALNDDSMTEMIDALSGSILVVADTTTGKKDFGTTPFEAIYPLSGIHTSILNGILTGVFFRDEPVAFKLCLIALLFVVVWFALTRKNDLAFHLLFASLFAFVIAIGIFFWFAFNIVPWVASLSISVAVTWIGGFTYRLAKSHEQKILLESALTRYFPRALAARVMSEGKVDLKPANKELSILFADISGFTKWSSDKSPEMVHAFLSDYLESMATIIFSNGGTVDKFIGDGILAFFGDPFEQTDHAIRALHTALSMQQKVVELREKWQEIANIDLQIRIGINSGSVIVGNLGSKTRIEYTVIGATVNLASRMESNAPIGGILVSNNTYRLAGDTFIFSEDKEVAAKGYDQPIKAYILAGTKN